MIGKGRRREKDTKRTSYYQTLSGNQVIDLLNIAKH